MKLTTILVLKIKLEILYFLTFNMNEMQNKKIIYGLKGKTWKKAHKCH